LKRNIDPNNLIGLNSAGRIELWTENYAKAKEYYLKALEVSSAEEADIVSLGYILWKTGHQEEARNMFNQALHLAEKAFEKGDERTELPINIAIINSIQGKKSEAYKWLEKAIETGWRWYDWSFKDPLLENLHNDERFKQLMAHIKAMVDEMRKRVEKE